MSFKLEQIEIGPMKNFLYLIIDEPTQKTLIVDPAWDFRGIKSVIEQHSLLVCGMVVTHAHYDHTNAITELLSLYDVPVYANQNEIPYSQSSNGIVGDLGNTVKAVSSEETLRLGETLVKFLHTPGHTPGSQCVLVGSKLITGDTLFIGGCGRTDLPGGDPLQLHKSLQQLAHMPSELVICPGHDYGTSPTRSLVDEIQHNPYLQMSNEAQFLNAVS